jgi:hypothetical protein
VLSREFGLNGQKWLLAKEKYLMKTVIISLHLTFFLGQLNDEMGFTCRTHG